MSQIATEFFGSLAGTATESVLIRRRNRTLAVLSVITFTVGWMIAAMLGVPAERGFDGSLLVQQSFLSSVLAVIAVGVSIAICTLILRAVLGKLLGLEILFAIAVGALAFSARGGSMIDLLQYHGNAVHLAMIVETVLIAALFAGAWWWLRPTPVAVVDEPESTLQTKGTALAVTAVVMIVLMHLLCQSPSKKQAIFSVAISACVGATVAFSFLGEMSPEPYLLAPLVVAVIGYVLALFGSNSTGQPTQVLAFPLPLHYAGAGVAGALLGYWTGLGWKQENEAE